MYHGYDIKKIIEHITKAPKKKLILDTSIYNGISDLFAPAYAMTAENLDIAALTAAPFTVEDSVTPEQGMEKSYGGLARARDFINPAIPCYRGSCEYMKNIITPVKSEAAENIVRIVNESDDIVYIVAMGCFTNVASALLIDPSIADKAVVVLLTSVKPARDSVNGANFDQDRCAARVILECGVPVVINPAIENGYIPLIMTNAEIAYYLERKSYKTGKFFYEDFAVGENAPFDKKNGCNIKERSVFDITTVALFCDPSSVGLKVIPALSIDDKGGRVDLNTDRKMLYVNDLDRDRIISDFFTTLSKSKYNN